MDDQVTKSNSNDHERERPEINALLVEYQAAQDSAQHHDNLAWSITGIIWGTSLVLLGFVVGNLTELNLKPAIIATSILAILLLAYLWTTALHLNSVKNQKYRRCKEIEEMLGLKQHTNLRYPKRFGRIFYGLVMFAFITAWLVVLIISLSL